jgi:hypothetical protein
VCTRFYVRDAEVICGWVREDAEYLGREQMGHFLAGITAAEALM